MKKIAIILSTLFILSVFALVSCTTGIHDGDSTTTAATTTAKEQSTTAEQTTAEQTTTEETTTEETTTEETTTAEQTTTEETTTEEIIETNEEGNPILKDDGDSTLPPEESTSAGSENEESTADPDWSLGPLPA